MLQLRVTDKSHSRSQTLVDGMRGPLMPPPPCETSMQIKSLDADNMEAQGYKGAMTVADDLRSMLEGSKRAGGQLVYLPTALPRTQFCARCQVGQDVLSQGALRHVCLLAPGEAEAYGVQRHSAGHVRSHRRDPEDRRE